MPFIQVPFITSSDGHSFKPIAGRGVGFKAANALVWWAMFPTNATEDSSGQAEAEFTLPADYVPGTGISIEIDSIVVDNTGTPVPGGSINLDAWVERYNGGWIRTQDNTAGPDHFTVPGTEILVYFVGPVADVASAITTTAFAVPASATFDFQNPAAGGWVTMNQPSFDNSGNPIPQTVTDIGWTILDDSNPGTGFFDLFQTHAVMNYAFQNDTPYLLNFGVPTQNFGILSATNPYGPGDKINIMLFASKGTSDPGGNNYLILGVRVIVGANSYNIPFGLPENVNITNTTWVGPGFNGSNVYFPIETVEDPAHGPPSDVLLNVNSFAFPALAPVPLNARAPAITGIAKVAEVLSISDFGFWDGWIYNFAPQWYRGASPITGATGETYTTTNLDLGKTITVGVRARTLSKILTPETMSNGIGPIVPQSFLLTETGAFLTQESGGKLEIE